MGETKLVATTKHIVKLLVIGQYEELERLTKGQRLTAKHLRQAVQEYGRHLTMPPDTVFEHLDSVEVEDAQPKTWSVRCHLWTEEEGCSDLSLELTLIDSDADLLIAEVDNIHVL